MSTKQISVPTGTSVPSRTRTPRAPLNIPLLLLGVLQLLTAALLIMGSSGLLTVAGWLLGLGTTGLTVYVLRVSSSGGSAALVEVLRNANAAHGDLSEVMPEQGDRAAREAAMLFNQFMNRLRNALEELRMHSIKVSLTSAQGRKMSEEASRNAGRQEQSSELIFRSSEETATAIEELSRWTSSIADSNSRNLQTAQGSVQNLQQAAGQIGSVSDMMHEFHGTVEQLETTSESIQGILGTVQGFAAQTNMLALNAAIEAARAGEQGRGFAVVADEVRDLAVKVRGAADEIGGLLEKMIEVVSQTSSGTEKMIAEAEQAKSAVGSSSSQFQRMVADFESAHSDLLQVSAAAEQLSVSNREVRSRSEEIRDLGLQIKSDMERSEAQTALVLESTDRALHKLCQFRIGRGQLEVMLEKMEKRRDAIQKAITQLQDSGVDMFNRNHKQIPGTNPVKYDIPWARPFQNACQHFIDEWTRDQDGSIYCLPLDNKGYVAIHRSEFSLAPCGDPKIDLVKSRHMRFFQNRDIPHMGRFRLQSYLRDTGEVMFNLSVPIDIHGRFWGGLFLGLPVSVLGIDKSIG